MRRQAVPSRTTVRTRAARPVRHATTEPFISALQAVLAHDLDRRILLEFETTGQERYEQLRRAVGEPSKQLFAYAIDRLTAAGVVDRRLEAHGRRYHSFLSPTPRATLMIRVLRQLARGANASQGVGETLQRKLAEYFVPPRLAGPAGGGSRVLDAATLFRVHRDAIQKILARRHLQRLVAFGSRARGDAGPDSDLDLAVERGPDAGPLDVLGAEADLERLLGVPVSIVELPNARLAPAIRRDGVPF